MWHASINSFSVSPESSSVWNRIKTYFITLYYHLNTVRKHSGSTLVQMVTLPPNISRVPGVSLSLGYWLSVCVFSQFSHGIPPGSWVPLTSMNYAKQSLSLNMYDRPLPGCIPASGQCYMDQQRVSDDTD